MLIVIVAFIVVFLLVTLGGFLFFGRNPMIKRVTRALDTEQKTANASLLTAMKDIGSSVGTVTERFKHVLPISEKEISATRARLNRAGLRSESSLNVFNGSKVLVPLLLCLLALITGLGKLNPFIVYLLALGVGFLGPEFWLDRRIKTRQKRIRRGLPDVLDMLVICTEAGLSLDQATVRATEEIGSAHPDLCDELGIVVLEQRAGRARSEAWKQLADRTDVDSIRNLVSMLVQSERFGTSVAKTMRTHAESLRVHRIQAIEEQAAKCHTKLVFPLVLFIFPSLFLVTLGPAIIMAMETFKK